jgi:hypothetical protein
VKKGFSFVLAVLLLAAGCLHASAEPVRVPVDLKSMTTEELLSLAEEINKEIRLRDGTAENEAEAEIVGLKLGDIEYSLAQIKARAEETLNAMKQEAIRTDQKVPASDPTVMAVAQKRAVQELKKEMVIRAKAAELGLDDLTDDEKKIIANKANKDLNIAKKYVQFFLLDEETGKLEGEALDQAIQAELDKQSISYEYFAESETLELITAKVKEYILKDLSISGEGDALKEAQETAYEEVLEKWISEAGIIENLEALENP